MELSVITPVYNEEKTIQNMETGYKVFRKDVIKSITPKLISRGYSGRTYAEGKKIHWWDGLSAIVAIIYFHVFSR